MTFFPESEADLARQITHALEDQARRPLDEIRARAPDDCGHFSSFECRSSEWSFGWGVAWALARMRDPFAPSQKLEELVRRLACEAWRSYGGEQSWTALMAQDRAERGPVGADPSAALDEFTRDLGRVQVRHGSGSGRSAPRGDAS
jgi:hypothetical protein